MSRRRGEYRTWEELSVTERRRGLAVLGGAGLAAVGVVFWVFGGSTAPEPVGAPAPVTVSSSGPPAEAPPAVSASPVAAEGSGLAEFYAATTVLRGEITAAEADVRSAIAQNSGRALQPACALLATHAAAASSEAPMPPTGDPGQAWSQGLNSYAKAAETCGHLFDGTRVAVSTLLGDTSTALDEADAAWARLAPAGTGGAVG